MQERAYLNLKALLAAILRDIPAPQLGQIVERVAASADEQLLAAMRADIWGGDLGLDRFVQNLAQRLIGEADEEPEREPRLLDWLRRKPVLIEHVPWLVKDFDVLYRSAQALSETLIDARDKSDAQNEKLDYAHQTLAAQLERLKPALGQIATIKAMMRAQQERRDA